MSVIREVHAATVTNIDDPERRGRVKVVCAAMLGDEDQELPMWIPPVAPWGWFLIPDLGEVIEIDVLSSTDDDEQFGQSSIDGLDPRYRSNRFWGNSQTDTPRPVPEDFTSKNYGKRRGFVTPKGLTLLFDDTDGDERLSLTWTNGKGKFAYIGMDKTGSLIAGNQNGALLSLDAKNAQAMLIDEFSNSIVMDAAGIRLIDRFGQSLATSNGAIQVLADAITLSCKNALVEAGKIDLAGDAEKSVLGDTWLSLFANHGHDSAMGPTGPAKTVGGGTVSLWESALSTKVNLS